MHTSGSNDQEKTPIPLGCDLLQLDRVPVPVQDAAKYFRYIPHLGKRIHPVRRTLASSRIPLMPPFGSQSYSLPSVAPRILGRRLSQSSCVSPLNSEGP